MKVDLYNDYCLNVLKGMSDNSFDLLVTSPPYYNAREYSQWNSVENYMYDMRNIFTEVYRCLKNHHYIVVNVADVTTQIGNAKWSVGKIPLGAMFTLMLSEIGFIYQDDIIWNKDYDDKPKLDFIDVQKYATRGSYENWLKKNKVENIKQEENIFDIFN